MENTNIIFEYHDVSASDVLETYTKEKLNAIFTKFDFVIRADVFFKTENTASDKTGKICGIRLSAPGPRLFAESSSYNFQDAVSETVRDLTSQLKRRKEMMKTH
ncbi:HPF/RaiA family ribosome-associated protein [Winogradskyella sp. Asnod2-B02-A]|uniref:HPF/RaiA family ribosome-associated protein n=1 Tax=Winogradskyella sp. Asnod2-B02-A TaxID=3160583 RepID=UPI0038661BF9